MPEDRRAKKEKKETVELRCLFLKNKTHGTVTTKQNRRKTLFIESLHNLLIILKLLWSYLLKRSCKNYPVCRHLQKTERVPDLFPTEWRNKKFLLKKKKPGIPKYSRRFPFDYYSRNRPALITTTFEKLRLNCDLSFVMTATSPLSDCDQFRDYPTGRCLCFYAVASDHSANAKGCIHINQRLETEHWVYWTLLKSCLYQMQSRSLNIHFFCFVLFFLFVNY